jgi:LPXTG-motif cell wall-anchored protein
MKINKKTLKTFVFSFVLAAMTLSANNLNAQNDGSNGLFGRAEIATENANLSESSFDITNEDFGAPVGSGLGILIAAGLGYVALKKKED